jgi:hypothetical protein
LITTAVAAVIQCITFSVAVFGRAFASIIVVPTFMPAPAVLLFDELPMFPVTIVFVMLTVAVATTFIPAPNPFTPARELPTLLLLTVLSLILRTIPAVTMEIPPPFPAVRLLVTTTRLSVKLVVAVSRRIPPPETFVATFPCRIVTSLITTAVAAVIQCITFSVAVFGRAFASIIVVPEPAPLIVISDVISKSPPALRFSSAATSVWV